MPVRAKNLQLLQYAGQLQTALGQCNRDKQDIEYYFDSKQLTLAK